VWRAEINFPLNVLGQGMHVKIRTARCMQHVGRPGGESGKARSWCREPVQLGAKKDLGRPAGADDEVIHVAKVGKTTPKW